MYAYTFVQDSNVKSNNTKYYICQLTFNIMYKDTQLQVS